jgi:hypothetical protein
VYRLSVGEVADDRLGEAGGIVDAADIDVLGQVAVLVVVRDDAPVGSSPRPASMAEMSLCSP